MKVTVREFLVEFLALTLPAWAGRFAATGIEWLQQEVFPNPPQGERRALDLVARVRLNQRMNTSDQALVHVEVEAADSRTSLRERMPRYHDYLGYQHGLPVLSLALYLEVAQDGLGWEDADEPFWEESLGKNRWPYLGLPGLDALTYVEGDNLLGVAFSALMRIPEERKAWLKARALQRVAASDLNAFRKHLLADFIEAYLPLVGPHLAEYAHILLTEGFSMARVLGQTSFEKGEEQGVLKGQRLLLRDQLEAKFGPLSETARQRLDEMPADRLHELSLAFARGANLADLGLANVSNGAPNAG